MTHMELAKTYQDELYRCRTAENNAAVELDKIRQHFGIPKDEAVFDYLVEKDNDEKNS